MGRRCWEGRRRRRGGGGAKGKAWVWLGEGVGGGAGRVERDLHGEPAADEAVVVVHIVLGGDVRGAYYRRGGAVSWCCMGSILRE